MRSKGKMVTIKELRNICVPNPERDQVFGKYFQRPFSIYFTWFFIKFKGINAEMVCFLWVLTAFIGGLLYFIGNYWFALLGLLLFHIGMVLDCADGEVARYKKRCTIRGPYLDLIGHAIVNPTILLGIGVYSYINPILGIPPVIFLVLGSISAILMININIARLKVYEALSDNGICIEEEQKRMKKIPKITFKTGLLRPLLRIGPGCLVYFATIFNLLPYYIIFMGGLLPTVYIKRVYDEYKRMEKVYDKK